jgi:hypothetical protein
MLPELLVLSTPTTNRPLPTYIGLGLIFKLSKEPALGKCDPCCHRIAKRNGGES